MIIVIDGNIGSGKSTVLDRLAQKGYTVCKEKIEEWPLDDFYKDPSRWAFLLQMSVLNSMHRLPEPNIIIHERCPDSSLAVFWENISDKGIVSQRENSVCKELYTKLAWKPDLHIFLDSNPMTCYERVSKRNQMGDTSVKLGYILQIDSYYKKYISNRNIKIIKSDREIDAVVDDVLCTINEFIAV